MASLRADLEDAETREDMKKNNELFAACILREVVIKARSQVREKGGIPGVLPGNFQVKPIPGEGLDVSGEDRAARAQKCPEK